MAMTIEQRPEDVTPAFNPVVYVVSSTNVAEPNHKFIIDVKVGGTLITREKFTPPPLQTNAFIDIGRIVSNLVKFDLDFTLIACYPMLNSQKDFTIEIGESYGGTDYLNEVSGTFTAVNIGLDPYQWLDYDFANYEQKILNKLTNKLRINSKAWLYFYQTNTNQVTGIRVTATNASGTNTISEIDNPYDASNPDDRFIYCPIGANMNDILAGSLTSGTAGNVLPADTVSVLIELLDTATVTDSHTYSIINSCYEDYEVYYLNSNGAFETLVFNKNFQLSNSLNFTNSERMQSKMLTSTSYGYNSYDAQQVNSRIMTRQKWKLNTDWINDFESKQIFEMVSSPVIFLNDKGTIKRVNQRVSNYNEELIRSKKMFNFSIELNDSSQFERQWLN